MSNINSFDYTGSIADFGAQRVLGMGGSLMGYIQTGNAYDKRYYHKNPPVDTFDNKNPKKQFNSKIISLSALGLAAIGSAFLLVKKGCLKFPDFSKLKLNKIGNLFNKIKVNK